MVKINNLKMLKYQTSTRYRINLNSQELTNIN
jgi:hypothetical protein